MAQPLTLHVDVLLPLLAMQVGTMDVIEQWLQQAGILAPGAEHRRWRMVPETGGYALMYDVTVSCPGQEGDP